MSDPTDVVEAITSRISLPDEEERSVDPSLTGELASLVSWWHTLADERVLDAHDITGSLPADTPAAEAIAAGARAVDRAVDAGATLVIPRVEMRDAQTAHVLIAVLTRAEPQSVVPQPFGLSDRAWMAEVSSIRDRAARLADHRAEPLVLLDGAGAGCIAFCAGALLGAAARRTACIVDGTDETAAALVADRFSTSAKSWWTTGSRSSDAARTWATDRIGLRDGLPLSLADEEGWGARVTVALLQMALQPPM